MPQLYIGIVGPYHDAAEFLLLHPAAFLGNEYRAIEGMHGAGGTVLILGLEMILRNVAKQLRKNSQVTEENEKRKAAKSRLFLSLLAARLACFPLR